jgi:hypothetical protein
MTNTTPVQDQAIQAMMAGIVGAKVFDRLFSEIYFDEIDGTMLYAFDKDEDLAAGIEVEYSLHIAAITSQILRDRVDIVVVTAKGFAARYRTGGPPLGAGLLLVELVKLYRFFL